MLPRPEVVHSSSQSSSPSSSTPISCPSPRSRQRNAQELAEKNQARQLDMAQEATNPFYVVLTPEGKLVSTIGGYNEPSVFLDFLAKALEKASDGMSLAQGTTGL